MIFVDTNYFLRFLLAEVNEQQKKAKILFQEAAMGRKKLFSSAIVFFEIYWVLTSFYGKNKNEIAKILANLCKMNFIKWENEEILEKTVKLFTKTNLDLEDSYNLAFARFKKATDFKTFDNKLKKFISGKTKI